MAGDGFRIATGYVEVETHYDQNKMAKAARSAMVGAEREAGGSGGRSGLNFGAGFLGGIFKSSPRLVQMFSQVFPRMLASPVGIGAAVIGGMFAASLAGAIMGSGILLGLGLGLAGLIAYGLKDNPQVKAAATSLKDSLSKALKDAAAPLAPSLISGLQVFESYVPGFGEKLKTIFSFIDLESLGANFAQAIDAFLAPLTDSVALENFSQFMRDAGDQLPRLAQYLGEFVATLMTHGPLMGQAFGILVTVLGTLLQILGFLIVQTAGWLVAFAAFWNFLTNAVSVGWAKVKEGFNSGLAWIKNAWNTTWGAVKAFFSSTWSSIQSAASTSWNWLRSTLGSFTGWVKSTWNSLWSGISSFFSSIWSGITGRFTSAVATARGIASGMVSSVKGALNGLSSIPGQVGGYFGGMVSQISSKIGSAVSTVKGLPGKIKSAVGNLGGLLVSAGRDIIQGLINGISNMLGALKSKLSAVTSLIPDWKGPMSVDMKLLEPSGSAIMGGLIRGIDKRVPSLRGQLQDLTSEIGGFGGSPSASPAPAAAASPVYNFAAGSIVLDASKIQSIQDLIEMINSLPRTARQWGATPMMQGV